MWLVWEHNKYTHTSSFEVPSIDYAVFSFVSSSYNLCLVISIFSLRTVSLVTSSRTHTSVDSLVWCCLVYLFIHCHVCNIGHVNCRLQFIYYNTTYNIWTQYNVINNNTKFKGQLEVESI